MYFTYAISSLSKNYIYVGMTDNLDRRVFQHQQGINKTTKAYRPFKLIYSEFFESRPEARKQERYLK